MTTMLLHFTTLIMNQKGSGYGHIGARTDTTQQSGQTPDKEVEIKNFTVYVSGYTETDTTGMLSPPTVCPFSVAVDINSNVFDFYFLIWSLSRLLCRFWLQCSLGLSREFLVVCHNMNEKRPEELQMLK